MSDENKLDLLLAGLGKLQENVDALSKRLDTMEKRKPLATKQTNVGGTHRGPQRQASGQSIEIYDRPNLFEEQHLDKLHKEDVKIDKLLSGGKTLVPRGIRSPNIVEITCCKCNNVVLAHTSTIPSDASRYKCNDCARQPG